MESEPEKPTPGVQTFDAQIAGDRAVIFTAGVLTSRELSSGRIVWTNSSDRVPVVTASRVFAFDKDNVKVLDAAAGNVLASWKPAVGMNPQNATAADGVIYVGAAEAVQTLGGTKYNRSLCALSEESGKLLWQSKWDRQTDYAVPIVIDDKVVVVSTDRIYAVKR